MRLIKSRISRYVPLNIQFSWAYNVGNIRQRDEGSDDGVALAMFIGLFYTEYLLFTVPLLYNVNHFTAP